MPWSSEYIYKILVRCLMFQIKSYVKGTYELYQHFYQSFIIDVSPYCLKIIFNYFLKCDA